MKCQVELMVGGKVFKEDVYAIDYDEARRVALARNPNATVIGVNADSTPDYSSGNSGSQVTFSQGSASKNYQGISLSNSDLVGLFVLILICGGLGNSLLHFL